MFECNDCCACPINCKSRVVQNTPDWPLEVFNTDNNKKGNGLRTNCAIAKGSFVIEYIGEVVTPNEAADSLTTAEKNGSPCYVLVTRELYGGNKCKYLCIDASKKGNKARFINHSCDPNLTPIPVRINSSCPHLALFARRNIECGEELTFSYGDRVDEHNVGFDATLYKNCYCGSTNCCRYLPFDKSCLEDP